jgi:hypothetical protein
MPALLVIKFQRDDQPATRVALPLSVIRANPKLLPKFAAEALAQHGIEPSELANLEGVSGPVLEISRQGLKLVVAIQEAPADGAVAAVSAASSTPANATPPPAAPAPVPTAAPAAAPAPAERVRAPEHAPTAEMGPITRRKYQSRNPGLETEQIAGELGWRTGHDLIFAACAFFTLNLKMTSFTLEDIDEEIKQSAKFYKPFYSINLNEYLQYLMKANKLHQPEPGEYAITPATLKYLEERLSPDRLRRRA